MRTNMIVSTGVRFVRNIGFMLLLVLSVPAMSLANGDSCPEGTKMPKNPTIKEILNNELIEKIEVYSIDGETKHYEIDLSTANGLLCFAQLEPGSYMFRIFTAHGTMMKKVKVPKA